MNNVFTERLFCAVPQKPCFCLFVDPDLSSSGKPSEAIFPASPSDAGEESLGLPRFPALTFFAPPPKYPASAGTLGSGVLPCEFLSFYDKPLGEARMKFRPLGDRVVVRRIKEDTKTAGGIIIPETAQEKPQEGEVIAVGPGLLDEKTGKRNPLEVKAGEFVLFGKWSGTEVKIDGEELLIMKESDIMGVVEGRKGKK